MQLRVIDHLRSNVVAYLALCCSMLALSGGAYAAIVLPANSVGARQIRKGSITPSKFNRTTIGGSRSLSSPVRRLAGEFSERPPSCWAC